MFKGENNLFRTYGLVLKCDKWSFIRLLVWTFAESILPLLNLYVLRKLIDGVTAGASFSEVLLPQIILFAVIFLLSRCVSTLENSCYDILSQRFIDYISDIVHRKSAEVDLAFYDCSDYHDTLYRAQQEASQRSIMLLMSSLQIFGSVISIATITAMLATASAWTLVIMVIAVIPSFFVRVVRARKLYALNKERTSMYRRSKYLSTLITGRENAMEVRARGLSGFLRVQYVKIREEIRKAMISLIRKMAAYDSVCAILEAAALVLITVVLLRGAQNGKFTVGTFVILFDAFRRGQSQLQSLTTGIARMYDNQLFINNLYEFLSVESNIHSPESPVPFPEDVDTIAFDDVTFRYPEGETPVLEHLNLVAHKGEITRIEGPNGFGKTTMVKLMLRLYDPQEGAVRINGIDIREFGLGELRRKVSAAFQQVSAFNFTVKENIAFGDVADPFDEEKMKHAAEASGFAPVAEKLQNGYDTMVGREFDNGEELSQGQRQRLAIARHLYSDAPIMIFDEPTAWLDMVSRSTFLENLEKIKKDRIVIFISHIQ